MRDQAPDVRHRTRDSRAMLGDATHDIFIVILWTVTPCVVEERQQ